MPSPHAGDSRLWSLVPSVWRCSVVYRQFSCGWRVMSFFPTSLLKAAVWCPFALTAQWGSEEDVGSRLYRGSEKGSGVSPDGHLQPGGRPSGPIPEKPGPPQATRCCLIQGSGRKSLFVQVWAFGKKPCSQASVLWVMEQLVKLFRERPDHKPAPLSRGRVSQAR